MSLSHPLLQMTNQTEHMMRKRTVTPVTSSQGTSLRRRQCQIPFQSDTEHQRKTSEIEKPHQRRLPLTK